MRKFEFKLNQRVWSPAFGWGIIIDILSEFDRGDYPIEVKFDDSPLLEEFYTLDGKYHVNERPTLFTEEAVMPVNKYQLGVGDWVVITNGQLNFSDCMRKLINRVVKVTAVHRGLNETSIAFKDSQPWFWCYEQGHFRLAEEHEIPV